MLFSNKKFALPAAAVLAGSLLCVNAQSQDQSLSRFLLIKLARDQSDVLCNSSVFTQCMGFTQTQCMELSEKSIEQCLLPLPERIELEMLENETIENCPKQIYHDAGYDDEKAQNCLAEALK